MTSDATEAALGLLGLYPLNAPQYHPHPRPHLHHHVVHPHGLSLTSTTVVDRSRPPPASPPSLGLKLNQPSPTLPSATVMPPSASILSSTKPQHSPHLLTTSSTLPINPNRLLPTMSTKSLTVLPQQHPQQHPLSPILSCSVPPQTPPTSQLPLPPPSTSQHTHTPSDIPPPDADDDISCICGVTSEDVDGLLIMCDDCSRWCHAACFGIIEEEVPEFWKCWECHVDGLNEPLWTIMATNMCLVTLQGPYEMV